MCGCVSWSKIDGAIVYNVIGGQVELDFICSAPPESESIRLPPPPPPQSQSPSAKIHPRPPTHFVTTELYILGKMSARKCGAMLFQNRNSNVINVLILSLQIVLIFNFVYPHILL